MNSDEKNVAVHAPDVTVIIPSLNPDEKLRKTVQSLLDVGFTDIILVNDGSADEFVPNFPRDLPHCALLVHEVNRGKGAAMKTAFRYYLDTGRNTKGVITVDGDGQHLAEDVLRCAAEMCKTDSVILGVRDFSGADIPARSKFGNRTTSFVFRIFCGLRVSDTQTGLRAIPAKYLSEMLVVDGDRYEYETNMLLQMGSLGIPSSEVGIQTVYIEENQTSHFRPVRDSIRIYGLILKFISSSAIAAIVDAVQFFLLSYLLTPVLGLSATPVASAGARIVSALVNYLLNKKAVFKNTAPAGRSLLRYCILAVGIFAASAAAVTAFDYLTAMTASASAALFKTIFKCIVEALLSLVSFRLQREWVFAKDKSKTE